MLLQYAQEHLQASRLAPGACEILYKWYVRANSQIYQNKEALTLLQQALHFYRNTRNYLGEANTLKEIGERLESSNDWESALQHYHMAAQLYRASNAHLGEAQALTAIGDIWQMRDNRRKAIRYYRSARKLHSKFNNNQTQEPYDIRFRKNFRQIIDSLDLELQARDYLQLRWLEQVLQMEAQVQSMKRQRRRLAIVRAVSATSLAILSLLSVGLDIKSKFHSRLFTLTILTISILFSMTTVLNEYFGFQNRILRYSGVIELLKMQGLQFFQLTGLYHNYKTHAEALEIFSEQVERIIEQYSEIDIDRFSNEFHA
ncbi:DUF4231 domain-containing protein [Leptolyngbya sp. GGD]|uniref:DUF4231 domain-containing protein n=1 Tax=Leptolyngbya sp. GGD TaxID=2997907 RepID=UPI00227A0149|nr:DUF4231 domain-containing protein [Leptolyngbya sp. GGD]MCY6494526.1 DUF4231 domain-containing protein [Leptolyngbya sp. GGD]